MYHTPPFGQYIWYMIYLLTAIGLPPGGSCTVHIYTQTIHRTTQNKQYIEKHKNLEQHKNLWNNTNILFLFHIIPTVKWLLFPYAELTYLSFQRTRSFLSDVQTDVLCAMYGIWPSNLDAFAKLRQATVSFVVSVCPSAWSNSAPTERIFVTFDIWVFFENLSRKLKFR